MISVELWSADEVAGWIHHIGLPEFAKSFLGKLIKWTKLWGTSIDPQPFKAI